MFESATPKGINELDIDEVAKLVDPGTLPDVSPKARLHRIKIIYQLLGFELSPDIALAAIAEPHAQLILTPAGGGKTTWSQIKAIQQKMIRPAKSRFGGKITGDRILCLVYNKHNVEQMKRKHADMVSKLNARINGLNLDTDIHATTMHAFCDYLCRQNVAKLGILGFNVCEDKKAEALMRQSITLGCRKESYNDHKAISESQLLLLYYNMKESLLEPKDLLEDSVFLDLGLSVQLIETIFSLFDNAKKRNRVYDFSDMLTMIYNLCTTDTDALAAARKYFEYIVADEVQDFTPVMWEILRLFSGDDIPLVCIGDDDQNIYKFRGADISRTLMFKELFPDSEVYTLGENRRCAANILKVAVDVISTNTRRFVKEIFGKRPGGTVEYIPYNTTEGQIMNVISRLSKMSADDLENTTICYRQTHDSALLTEMLEEHDIPFNVISGMMPFSHELYYHVLQVLNCLEMPNDRHLALNLYKVLPCTREQLQTALGFNTKTNQFSTPDEKLHFIQYDYGNLLKMGGFLDSIAKLAEISDKIETAPLSEYIGEIYHLLQKYYWNFKRSNNEDEAFDDIFEKRVYDFFNVKMSYPKFFTEYTKRKGKTTRNTELHNGVTISTFHGLKGLEFKHVIVIGMDNDIFPNFSYIESRNYPKHVELDLKECETRLWYVAVTRARDSLTVYYNAENPSVYLREAIGFQGGLMQSNKVDLEDIPISQPNTTAELSKIDGFQDDWEDLDFFELGATATPGVVTEAVAVTSDPPPAFEQELLQEELSTATHENEVARFVPKPMTELIAESVIEMAISQPAALTEAEIDIPDMEEVVVKSTNKSSYFKSLLDSL